MNSLIFSFNVVMPVFLVVGIGYFVKSIGLVDEQFINTAIKFNFRVCLSTLLFKNIYTSDLGNVFNPKIMLFVLACIVGTVIVLWLIVPVFVKDKKKASAMIHTIYRSNYILLGIPLAANMFGESNIALASILIAITIPAYNCLAVVILAAFDENINKNGRIKSIIISIIKNPLILGSLAGVMMKLFSLKLPLPIESAVSSVASIGTPFALITLGAQFNFKNALGNLKYSLVAVFGRLIVVPMVTVSLAILCGFRGYELGILFVLFSCPTAVSSYIMAKEMNSDYHLTSDIVLISTFFSMFTIFIGIYLLRTFSLI